MDKREKMLTAFVDNIKNNYQDDVGLVIVYGSYVTQTMHELSDVDVMFVGKTERAYSLQKQFIYEGVGYDFFCMSVERLHQIIADYQPLISIIAEGRLLYADSEEKVGHFHQLQARLKTLDTLEPIDKYHTQIESVLKEMKVLAFDHLHVKAEIKRHLQGKMIYEILHLIQLFNRKHYQYGTKKIIDELQTMTLKPKTTLYYLELLTKDSVQSSEIMTIVQTFESFYQSFASKEERFDKNTLNGFYEEEVSVWNKLINAVKSDDIYTGFLAATSIENELSRYRKHYINITNLFSTYDSEVESLLDPAKKAEIEILNILKENKITINTFSTLEEVLAYLSK